MNFTLRSLFILLFLCLGGAAMAQTSGIAGVLTDEKGEPVVNGNVTVTAGGQQRGATVTNFDGEYVIKPLDAGRYDITFRYQGKSSTITGVIVNTDALTTVNEKFQGATKGADGKIKEVEVRAVRPFVKPLINPRDPSPRTIKTKEDIDKAATISTTDMATLGTQSYQSKNGAAASLGGGRPGSNTLYVVDGQVLASGNASFTSPSVGSVDQISTMVSGIPAKYGDATGGVITITTVGFSDRTKVGLRLQHSIDGYNNNLAAFNLSGPLVTKRLDASAPKRTIIGYTLNGDVQYNKDPNPSYYRQYRANSATQARLEQSPLVILPGSSGDPQNNYVGQTVRLSDLEQHKSRDNVSTTRYSTNGKLVYVMNDRITVTAGGEYYQQKSNLYDAANVLFNSANNAQSIAKTGRGYLRLTQKFANPATNDSSRGSKITNAFYTLQANYQKDYVTTQNKDHGHNTFDYGYIGRFEQQFRPSYVSGRDSATQVYGVRLVGYAPTGINFTRDEVNPLLANYTSQYYNITNPGNIPNLITISDISRGYLRNGDNPTPAYGLFNSVGTSTTGYGMSNNDQISVQVDASFDLTHKRTTHSIEFGLYYQQRTERQYSINAMALWNVMRLLTTRVVDGSSVDYKHPTFVVNGRTYTVDDVNSGVINPGPNDTIIYPRLFNRASQTAFDRNLRAKLGADTTTYLNTDAIDRSNYSLNMFTPDELAIAGVPIVNYEGYDHTGKRVNGQVNFNDYFTAKDANGNFTRPIGAYRPSYIAGYLSDYIQYKDFKISLGVRVERFDANTKVLKDPYSFVETRNLGSYLADYKAAYPNYTVPSSISNDFIPYVGENTSKTPVIIGYRNGETWYDASGTEVQDPLTLTRNANASRLFPLIQKDANNKYREIIDSGYSAENSFVDYKPAVNVMPRVNFSFPLNPKALFYAHYDVMVQRPTSGNYATGADYRALTFQPTTTIGNPDLKPEKLIDYEVGFTQVLTSRSSVTLSGFYKERKDQIQLRQYYQAYPSTYFTYGNRDFSTTKGFSINYELHRISNLTMSVNYTLSFNEGTGSSPTSSSGLLANYIGAGLPNQRNLFPLSYDSRHNINAQIDYRYGTGEGPTISGTHFLQNAGANLIFRTRSGEPYTRYLQPNSSTIAGAVNGSRLPWHYMFDLNIDKDFRLGLTKGDETRRAKFLTFNVFMYIQNLFNTRDILSVYGYTGLPDDNGYLTSAQGMNNAQQQVDQQSYKDLYGLSTQDINYLNNPRRINVGIKLNF